MGHLVSLNDRREWYETLAAAGHYDIYHLPEYHQLEIAGSDHQAFLYVFEKNDNIALVPFIRRSAPKHEWLNESFFDASSVYGYPGPLVKALELVTEEFSDAFFDDLRRTLRLENIVTFFMRSHPVLTPPALIHKHRTPVGKTVCVDLTVPLDEQLANCRKSHRYEYRKALRNGVVARHAKEFEDVDQFIAIYNQHMKLLSASDAYFFPDSYYEHLQELLPDKVKLVHALKDDAIIGSALFFVCGDGVQYHLSATKEGCLSYSPTRVILEEMRSWSAGQGYRWMHLGGGVGGAEDSLFRFKSGLSPATTEYSTCQIIADAAVYERLREQHRQHYKSLGVDASACEYFPAYRAVL